MVYLVGGRELGGELAHVGRKAVRELLEKTLKKCMDDVEGC